MADILSALEALATERRPDDGLLGSLLPAYYSELPDEDADGRRRDDLYAAAAAHLRLGRRRRPGEHLVQILSPDLERDGWHSPRSVLMFVTDDIPFLVDTVRLVLDRHDLGIHLLVHPTLIVTRDADGVATSVRSAGRGEHDPESGSDPDGTPGLVEAWTQIELDRCPNDIVEIVERDVLTAIGEVHRVVDDFDEMQARLLAVADGDPLLVWLGVENLVLLGAATYQRTDDGLALIEGSGLGQLRSGARLDATVIDPPSRPDEARVVIARTDAAATIHRHARMLCVCVRPPGTGLEYRFVGLLGSAAYRESVFAIPVLADRATEVLELSGAPLHSHTGRAIKHVVETLPRDLVFELDADTLAQLVIDIVGLQERRIVRAFDVAEPVGPWTTVLVYVPRSRFTATLPDEVAALVAEHYGGDVRDAETLVGTSSLARMSMSVRAKHDVDLERLAHAIDRISETWDEQTRRAAIDALGPGEGERIFDLVAGSTTAEYRARNRPADAVADFRQVATLLASGSITTSFGRAVDAEGDDWRFRVYFRGPGATLAELVPILGQLGLQAVEEHPVTFDIAGEPVSLYEIGVRAGRDHIDDLQRMELRRAFVGLVLGTIERDELNHLILDGALEIRQVGVLRLYHRYLRQVGFRFSASYIAHTLVRQSAIARLLVELFDARFDPALGTDTVARAAAAGEIRALLLERLDAVPSLDEDRICRAFLTLIDATARTNAFRSRWQVGDEIAVKLRPSDIPFLPEPRPQFEIFVCSPKVEGVHLRGGPIARGGLRWSDRAEDFRTEILGLMKAQMVKNAVIVPVGAKGGFVVKGSTAAPTDRDAVREEGIDRYRRFVRAMLDVTDNVVDGVVVNPLDCMVHDEPDPYLVVAADKGTASFSDIANEIAIEHGFWLGDAFASGGSHGFDHKQMGITARGAWESVRRHGRVLGVDVDRDPITVVGVGDMSGDVFGNGMLLSDNLRLVAAFDHRHIFLDPDPPGALAHAERRRLFELPRSSWADYDTSLISPGGGVYPRSVKSIAITDSVRRALGVDAGVEALRPDDLISAILCAPVDLFWNGGIGTYVKASSESNDAVGDRANDAARVDGLMLRCRMVGEGGNLGFTQLGRSEYALAGGLIYTDAIDNSAGVDCSDHEVNIKIALDQLVRDGELTSKQRNTLLADMTDDVAELVLENNRAQTLALMIAREQALSMVNVHARYLDSLEAEGILDRELEFLPSDKQIAERQSAGRGLGTPDFAVMIAYTKTADISEVLDTDLPDDPALDSELLAYFPPILRERFPDTLRAHRLRREIITTTMVNTMVNLAGISFDHRMTEDTGSTVADVLWAFTAARRIVELDDQWVTIEALDQSVPLDTQIALFLEARRSAERAAGWLLRHRAPSLGIDDVVNEFATPISTIAAHLDSVVTGRVAADIAERRSRSIDAGVPAELAARAARWPWMHPGFDIVEVARERACSIEQAMTTYWSMFDAFDLYWLWEGIGALPRSDRWHTQARSALRDDLLAVLASLTRNVLVTADGSPSDWIANNQRSVGKAIAMHTEIRRAESFDLTTLSVALRQLRNLTVLAR